MKKFSVIIPSYNEGSWLEKTVFGVLENTDYPDFEIIVVADGCTDNSLDFLLQKSLPNVRLLQLHKSVGAIRARNLGAAESQAELLVFIDSHEIPLNDNWLKILSEGLKQTNAGALTTKITSLSEPDKVGCFYAIKDYGLEPHWKNSTADLRFQKTPVIPGGCFAIKREVFEKTGGFNQHLKKWGREDLEYSLRLWCLGYDQYFSPASSVGHAFHHKRKFEISWEEVDYNTLYIALRYTSSDFFQKVKKHLESVRPKTTKKFLETLSSQFDFANLNQNFQRNFSDYEKEFSDFLPLAEI